MSITTWLKSVGSSESPLRDDWYAHRPDVAVNIGFPSRRTPTVAVGDRLVYYASGSRRVFALVEVLSDPYLTVPGDEHHDPKYAWRVHVKVLRCVLHVSEGPRLADLGVARDLHLSVRQASHVRLCAREVVRVYTLWGVVFAAV